jgi:hypothetical protein
LIFSLNEAVTLKSRSRTIKIGHGNTLIPSHLLVKFGHETRKKWCKETKKERILGIPARPYNLLLISRTLN